MEGFIAGALLVAIAIGLAIWSRNRKSEREAQPRDVPFEGEIATSRPRTKKRKKRKKGEAIVDQEALALGAGSDPLAPRQQHYLFAHQLLRRMMVGEASTLEPLRASAIDGTANAAVQALWDGAGKMALAMEGRRDVIPGGPPTIEAIEQGILIRMPSPTAMPEAHFIAVVRQAGMARYFVVEKSLIKPCLCEWTDDAHVNLGPIEADESTFLAAVRARIAD